MIKKMVLSESFQVNHPQIDGEHQGLIDEVNALYDMLCNGDREAFLNGLSVMFEHIVEHFENEIAILRRLDFPGAEKHATYHEKLMAEFPRLQNLMKSDTEALDPDEFYARMIDFLAHDVVHKDLEFKSFLIELNRSGLGDEPSVCWPPHPTRVRGQPR